MTQQLVSLQKLLRNKICRKRCKKKVKKLFYNISNLTKRHLRLYIREIVSVISIKIEKDATLGHTERQRMQSEVLLVPIKEPCNLAYLGWQREPWKVNLSWPILQTSFWATNFTSPLKMQVIVIYFPLVKFWLLQEKHCRVGLLQKNTVPHSIKFLFQQCYFNLLYLPIDAKTWVRLGQQYHLCIVS